MKHDFYFAGPLFTQAEKDFNRQLTEKIRSLGFEVFLPQEACESVPIIPTPHEIFMYNKINIDESENLIVICDGADVDSGTSWEAGYFYGSDCEGEILALRTDFRKSADCPSGINLMISYSADIIFDNETSLIEYFKTWCE